MRAMAKTSMVDTSTVQGRGGESGTRSQAPIRWPKLNPIDTVLVLIWAAGVAVALLAPMLFVRPGELTAPAGDIIQALTCTAVGSLVMLVSSYILFRRTAEVGVFVLGGVPAFTCLAGGIILAATKLTGTGTGVGVG